MPKVSYTLLIDDAIAPPELLATVQLLEVEDHARLADMLHLRLLVGVKENGSGWTLLDDGPFERLSRIRVKVQIGSTTHSLIEAYVIETRVQFSNQPGKSVLDVYAMDPTVLLNLDEKVRAWPNMTHGDIATQIFQDYGFDPVVDPTTISHDEDDTRVTQRSTDIQFLQQLAGRNGYECFVELNPKNGKVEGHFHPPRVDGTPQGVLSVNSGEATNVSLFNARYDMLRPVQATGTTIDIDSQSDQAGQAVEQSLPTLGKGGTVPSDRPRRVLLSQTGLTSAAELQVYAQGVVDESSFAILAEGELSTVAYGSLLQAKRAVSVRGAGRVFSGTYYVERVLHTFSGEGHRQKFRLRRNALGLQGRERFVEDGALPG